MPRSIFLCHSSRDKEFARRLYTDLRARGQRVWIDEAEMRVGDSLIGKLEAAIDDVDYLAVILSDHSVQSEWVLREVRMAMHREISGKHVFVLIESLFTPKLRGQIRGRLIDIACETLAGEENKDDDSDVIILLAIHSVLGPENREELMSAIKKHAAESQRVSLLGNYLSEQITWEEFIDALNKM